MGYLSTVPVAVNAHGYEFMGPPGAFAISFGLPIVCYLATLLCNDISGCPVPAVLSPSTLALRKLKQDAGWPENGFWGLANWDATIKVLAYYALSLVLQKILPGEDVQGAELASGGKLKYKFNTWSSTMVILSILAAGTIAEGANFSVWTYIYDNCLQILTANLLISTFLAVFVYVRSFSVKVGNVEKRELAAGGQSGNMLYDWFIGRELNPRVNIPLIGKIDIKSFCELRPGLLGWLIMDFTYIAHQYRSYGYITDSILLITGFQVVYVLDSYWMESAILTTMDITTDGFGYMLAFGDLVWVPFIYSLQARYLSVYPYSLGWYGSACVLGLAAIGYYIFRSANNQKNMFRTNPGDRRVKELKWIQTKSGSKLLISGWWGTARHINYTGDWIMAWAYCLTTGMAGYIVQHSSMAPTSGQSNVDGSYIYKDSAMDIQVIQGAAKGWGMVFTYFYVIYFGILLVHREMRDEEKCERKYGDDWRRYKGIVRWRLVPGVY